MSPSRTAAVRYKPVYRDPVARRETAEKRWHAHRALLDLITDEEREVLQAHSYQDLEELDLEELRAALAFARSQITYKANSPAGPVGLRGRMQ